MKNEKKKKLNVWELKCVVEAATFLSLTCIVEVLFKIYKYIQFM